MSVTPPPDEPSIPARMQRPLAAVWISVGLHAALIALVQLAPPVSVGLGEPVIEARLVSPHAGPESEVTPDMPSDAVPPLAASESAEAVPVAPALAPSDPAPPAAAQPAAPVVPEPPVAPVAVSPLAVTSAVDLTYYGAREVDVHPRALREIAPDYPEDAERLRQSGKVRLKLKLEADGRVVDVEVVDASPPGIFDEAAIKAFRAARFVPALKNGRPVRALVLIEVTFDWEGQPR